MHCTHLRCVAHAAIYAEQRAADAEAMTNTRLLKQPATADIIGTDYKELTCHGLTCPLVVILDSSILVFIIYNDNYC